MSRDGSGVSWRDVQRWESMPYKFNESRRHKIPRARHRVTNWPDYEAALVRRGSLTVWFTEEAVEAWHAPATGERGGQPTHSATAIETGLALRLVFHQPLRQTEGLLRSVANVLKVDIAIPGHTTLSRRGGTVKLLERGRDKARNAGQAHWRSRHAGNAGHFGPGLEGAGPGGSVLGGGEVIATKMEEVVDLVVRGEETLRVSG